MRDNGYPRMAAGVLALAVSLAVLGQLALTSVIAWSQAPKAKPQPPRPTPKPGATAQPPRGVKGAPQMAGDNGKMGVTYTIGKGDNAINFTLVRAEYATRVVLKDDLYVANEEEKLLVLHYTAQNPNPQEMTFNWSSLKFTAVDSENVNREGAGLAGKEGSTETYDIYLKPGQKIDVFTIFRLPAKATVPKIIVQRRDDLPVLRLYLAKTEIKGMTGPFADPSDPNGAIIRADVPAEKDTYYPLGQYDVKVVGAQYLTEKLGDIEAREGSQLYIVTLSIRNATMEKKMLSWSILDAKLKTTDGETIHREGLLMPRRNENLEGELEPGEEITARLYYQVPKDSQVTRVSLWEGENGRRLAFDVKDWK